MKNKIITLLVLLVLVVGCQSPAGNVVKSEESKTDEIVISIFGLFP